MPLAYQYHPETKKYTGEVRRQLDPLETQKAHIPVWLMPANSTEKVPPKEKDGYEILWDEKNSKWVQKKIEVPEPEPTPEPTELELLYQELYEVQSWLSAHDYIGTKIATGRATKKDYAEEIAQMTEYAERVSTIKERIKELESKE